MRPFKDKRRSVYWLVVRLLHWCVHFTGGAKLFWCWNAVDTGLLLTLERCRVRPVRSRNYDVQRLSTAWKLYPYRQGWIALAVIATWRCGCPGMWMDHPHTGCLGLPWQTQKSPPERNPQRLV